MLQLLVQLQFPDSASVLNQRRFQTQRSTPSPSDITKKGDKILFGPEKINQAMKTFKLSQSPSIFPTLPQERFKTITKPVSTRYSRSKSS